MRVFISTNESSPKSLYEPLDRKLIAEFLTQHGFVSGIKDRISEVFENIYLISDEIPVLPSTININQETDYLLWHRSTSGTLKDQFGKNKIEGHHTQNSSDHYAPVFRILLDVTIEEKNKATLILDVLGFGEEQKKLEELLEPFVIANPFIEDKELQEKKVELKAYVKRFLKTEIEK